MLNFFISFYFMSILSSISLMDLAATFLIGWLVWNFFKNKPQKIKPPPKTLSILLIIWMSIIALGLIINKVPFSEALVDCWRFKWILNFYLSYYIFSNWRFNHKFYHVLFVLLTVAMLYAISVTVFGHDFIRPTKAIPIQFLGGLRTAGFLGNAMTFAQSMGIVFTFLCSLLLSFLFLKPQKNKEENLTPKQLLILKGIVTITWIAILFSFTRSVWLSGTIAVTIIAFLTRPRFGWIAGLLLVGSIVAMMATNQTVKDRVVKLTSPQENDNSGRLILWKTNFEIFKESPIFGIGFGQNIRQLPFYYQKLGIPQDSFKADAHNQYLNNMAGTGILGLACYLIFFGLLFKEAWLLFRTGKQNHQFFKMALGLTIVGSLIHLFIAGFFECNFEDSSTLHCFLFFVGWMLASRNMPDELAI
jgi:O-antigen ligase